MGANVVHDTDIVISGAGLVGSALALALARQNPSLAIVVVDPNADIATFAGEQFDPRVVALNESSIDFLSELGVWPEVLRQRACPYRAMKVWDGEGNGAIDFHCDDSHKEFLGYIVENAVLNAELRRQLLDCDNVQMWLSARLDQVHCPSHSGANVTVTVDDGRRLSTQLLLAADGARSHVRKIAGFATREWSYQQSALVATVTTEQPHEYTAWQRFTHQGPLALLPLTRDPNGRADSCISSIVWSLDTPEAQRMQALEGPAFCTQLAAASEHRLGAVTSVADRLLHPLVQIHAKDYVRPGVALVGDAAHSIHPLAGQGVNLGLTDAQILAGEIARAQARGVDLRHESLLKRYQRQRKAHNLAAMAAMEGFKRLFGSEQPMALLARNRGLDWVDRSVGVKRLLMSLAAGAPVGR